MFSVAGLHWNIYFSPGWIQFQNISLSPLCHPQYTRERLTSTSPHSPAQVYRVTRYVARQCGQLTRQEKKSHHSFPNRVEMSKVTLHFFPRLITSCRFFSVFLTLSLFSNGIYVNTAVFLTLKGLVLLKPSEIFAALSLHQRTTPPPIPIPPHPIQQPQVQLYLLELQVPFFMFRTASNKHILQRYEGIERAVSTRCTQSSCGRQ